MRKSSNSTDEKKQRLLEIKALLHSFCEAFLNEELEGYVMRLSDKLSRKRKISLMHGNQKIWAAAIIYTIARLNFLFDKENEMYISHDQLCDFFEATKSTVGKKATQIEEVCNLTIGAEGYCSQEITDTFTYYQTPEGFIIPKSMLGDRKIIIESVEGEEADELEKFAENQRNMREQEQRNKASRKTAQKTKKQEDDGQLNLLDDL